MVADDAVDPHLPLEGEVDADLAEEGPRRLGEVVAVASQAVAGGLAGGEHRAPVRAAARCVDDVWCELPVDRSAELVHGVSSLADRLTFRWSFRRGNYKHS